MLLHVLDTHLLGGSVTQRRTVGVQICETCQESGCFYLTYPPTHATLCQQVLQQAHTFFDLPLSNKSQIDIRLSPHFRGYSQMKNQRDWREQVHFGLEQPAAYLNGRSPAYRQLQGPNLWLLELGNGWRNTMLSFLGAVGILGQQVLSTVALALELPENYFAALAEEPPYLLMKLICYHPLPVNQPLRIGVAPHCDWSWMTFLLQDNTGGLQVQSRDGAWIDAPPIPNTFVINIGELLEILTNGYLKAVPHRVINRSVYQSRLSVPVFINPALSAPIAPILLPERADTQPQIELEHVHRVVDPHHPIRAFLFGESEWHRKGRGHWCYNEDCLG